MKSWQRISMTCAMAVALSLEGFSVAAAQSVAKAQQHSYSIARGTLRAALDQFAKQSSLQLGEPLTMTEQGSRLVGPVVGRMTADAALDKLLAATDLSFAWEDGSTIRIFAVHSEPGVLGTSNKTNW